MDDQISRILDKIERLTSEGAESGRRVRLAPTLSQAVEEIARSRELLDRAGALYASLDVLAGKDLSIRLAPLRWLSDGWTALRTATEDRRGVELERVAEESTRVVE
jgi:hypothetical protein